MERYTRKKIIKNTVFGISAIALACSSAMVTAGNSQGDNNNDQGGGKSYSFNGTCAFLPADRATEFHGNPSNSDLNLGMAGNQWVVFDKVMQAFNLSEGNDSSEPAHRENDSTGFKRVDLESASNRYFIELIPPGQIRKQIKSGCMTLGNDEERNFLPGNYTVDFDVFASTNYDLMQDLANNGFIDEAVPYINNRLDLMVAAGNPHHIGTDSYTGDIEFDRQFDIAMDLLSGDIVTNKLDHINEGIHNASNGYMKKVDAYINGHAQASASITMDYTYGDGTSVVDKTQTAAQWLEDALQHVKDPASGSPGEERLVTKDAGENHTSHNLVALGCGTDTDLVFCEFALLNKFNTHESRVHHVEVPNGLVGAPDNGYVPVDVGFVWITELAYVINNNLPDPSPVTGMNGTDITNLGIPNDGNVNGNKTYSLALVATSKNQSKGNAFIDFLRSYEGQQVYAAGGFTPLTGGELVKGKCYAPPVDGVSAVSDRETQPGGKCPDWLHNGSF